jgi:hypothetical protein
MSVRIVHGLAAKLRALCRGVLAARRIRTVVAPAIVETVIDVPVEVIRPMEPWPGAKENTA